MWQKIRFLKSATDKIAFLLDIDAKARAKEPTGTTGAGDVIDLYREILIAATDGTLGADIRPLVRLSIAVLAGKMDAESAEALVLVVAMI